MNQETRRVNFPNNKAWIPGGGGGRSYGPKPQPYLRMRQTKIFTQFKALVRKVTPYSREKQKSKM